MSKDPWSRPTAEDLKRILESIEKSDTLNQRDCERLVLSVPAEVVTRRGNSVPTMTREVSRTGIGLIHRGALNPEEVTVKMASEDRNFVYRVLIEWCQPCENGMFISGGRFLHRDDSED